MNVTFTAEITLPVISDRLVTIETEASRVQFLISSVEGLRFFPLTSGLRVTFKSGDALYYDGKVAEQIESYLLQTIKELHGIP